MRNDLVLLREYARNNSGEVFGALVSRWALAQLHMGPVPRIPVLLVAAFFSAILTLNAHATTYYVNANGANPTPPYTSWSTAATTIQDAVDVATNGDLVLVTNGVYQPSGRAAPDNVQTCVISTNAVTIQSVNGSVATTISGSGNRRCVYLGNGAVFSGFTVTGGNVTNTYSTCGGIDCASNALVENCLIINNAADVAGGLYSGTASNCMISGNIATDQAGGAQLSILINCTVSDNYSSWPGQGGGATYCNLTNCVLTGNSVETGGQGGGAFQSTLVNCILNNNSATLGGGAAFCTLNNCLVFSNSVNNAYTGPGAFSQGGGLAFGLASNCIILGNVAWADVHSIGGVAWGGGAYDTTLNNCTVVDNYAAGGAGGGAYYCPAYNSIIYYNTAFLSGVGVHTDNVTNGSLNYCCTIPLPSSGFFNFTNAPLFVSISGTGGNLHLQSNSPCINAGNNAYVASTTDLDGNPRIVGGAVDAGAYEYQAPSSVISYAYLQQYGLPTDGTEDFVDLDGTGFNVYQDWIAGLNPTNAASVLVMLPPAATNNAAGITVSWESVSGISYNLQRSTNLAAQPAFSTIQTNIIGQAGTTSYSDTTATNYVPYFYRVDVQH